MVCQIRTLNCSVLRRLIRQDNLYFSCMFLCPFSHSQRENFWTIIHTQYDRVSDVYELTIK